MIEPCPELVFVSGHPGATSRLNTMAQLEYLRDTGLPNTLKALRGRIGSLERYSAGSTEQARQAASQIFFLQNSVKAEDGVTRGLLDARIMAKKQAGENEFKATVMANPEWAAAYGGAWEAMEAAQVEKRGLYTPYLQFEQGLLHAGSSPDGL